MLLNMSTTSSYNRLQKARSCPRYLILKALFSAAVRCYIGLALSEPHPPTGIQKSCDFRFGKLKGQTDLLVKKTGIFFFFSQIILLRFWNLCWCQVLENHNRIHAMFGNPWHIKCLSKLFKYSIVLRLEMLQCNEMILLTCCSR